jgi:predicted transcriptional regulator
MPKTTKPKNNVKQLRERLGYDQRDWARILGVSTRTVERWDDGVAPAGLANEVFRGIEHALADGVELDVIRRRLSLGLATFIHGFLTGDHPPPVRKPA